MAGSKSNDLENKLLDHALGGGDYTRPATVYIGLWKAALSDTSTGSTASEADYTGYTRVAVTNNATNFPAASGGAKSNGTAVTFGTNSGSSNTIVAAAVLDASVNGNILYWGDVTSTTVNNGDTPKFNIGGIALTED